VRQIVPVLLELGDLLVVLREHDPALGVPEDVRRVLAVGRGVHGGRRARGAHDREVREDPLVPGGRRDADPLLGLQAERQETRGELLDDVAGLPPGDGLPSLPTRVPERLQIGGGGDAVEELHREVLRHVVDEAGVDGRAGLGGHLTPAGGRVGRVAE
jgi:hypothetical protein